MSRNKKVPSAEIAAALGVTRQRVDALAKQGMPTDSVAAAQAWRVARKGKPTANDELTVENLAEIAPVDAAQAKGLLAGLEARCANARRLADVAQRRALSELECGDGEAAKRAGEAASGLLKTLLLLERELRQRRIDAGELVPVVAAEERFGRIVGELLAAIDSGEAAFARDANPDNPGRAVSAFRRFRDAFRRKVSAHVSAL